MSNLYPCDDRLEYGSCCQPYLTGEKYATKPIILMRSRYTAYVKHNVDYLIATWLTEYDAIELKIRITETFTNTKWRKLNIIEEDTCSTGNEAVVEFIAQYINVIDNKIYTTHQRSGFLRLNERGYYVDNNKPQPYRNIIFLCLSGKKT